MSFVGMFAFVVPPLSVLRRFFINPFSKMFPPVVELHVHLKNQHSLKYNEDCDDGEIADIIDNFKATTLIAFFENNKLELEKPLAQELLGKDLDGIWKPRGPDILYQDYPEYYIFTSS
jgi:hypothetical protein